jgi:hypothetical protein
MLTIGHWVAQLGLICPIAWSTVLTVLSEQGVQEVVRSCGRSGRRDRGSRPPSRPSGAPRPTCRGQAAVAPIGVHARGSRRDSHARRRQPRSASPSSLRRESVLLQCPRETRRGPPTTARARVRSRSLPPRSATECSSGCDRPGHHRAGGRDNAKGLAPFGPVGLDRLLEEVDTHPMRAVSSDSVDRSYSSRSIVSRRAALKRSA